MGHRGFAGFGKFNQVMSSSDISVASIESFSYLDSVEKDWLELVGSGTAGHIFLTPFWARAWWCHLGRGEPRVLEVKESGRVQGLIPLLMRDGVTTLLGDKDVCDYLDILSRPGQESKMVETLLEDFNAREGVLELLPLRPDSVLWRYLPGTVAKYGWRLETEAIDVSFVLDLPSSWDEYLQLLRGKDRHELRRKLRNLQAAGEVRFCSRSPTDKDMDVFFHLFRISREDKNNFMTPRREAFFRQIASHGGDQGWVKLGFLELDGKRVATALCFDYGGVVSLYNSGYDPDYAPLSAGLLCKALTIREAIEKGRKVYDFLRGAEDYKFHLGGKPFPIYRAVVAR